jgi:hypothetical protein
MGVTTPVWVFVAVTEAPAMTAPELSETVPWMLPVPTCANATFVATNP